MALSQTIDVVGKICDACPSADRGYSMNFGTRNFRAQRLEERARIQLRYAPLRASQLFRDNLAVIEGGDNVLDGMKRTWGEFTTGRFKGTGVGGYSKRDCFFDPCEWGFKETSREIRTNLVYKHNEFCTKKLIGSKFQSGQDGYLQLINTTDTTRIGMDTSLQVEIMARNVEQARREVDGHAILGNYGEGGKKSKYPLMDGAAKMTLLQGTNTQFASGYVDLPALTGGDSYYFGTNDGNMMPYASVADVVTAINSLETDVTGEKELVAYAVGQRVYITANNVEAQAYGRDVAIIKYSSDGFFDSCSDALQFQEEIKPMAYGEEPYLVEFSIVPESDSWNYWKSVIQGWDYHLTNLFEDEIPADLGNKYILIDPFLLKGIDYNLFDKLCNCGDSAGAQAQLNWLRQQLGVALVPFLPFKGTGYWFGTFQSNFVAMTNASGAGQLGDVKVWYDDDCDTIKSKYEMLLGFMVGNYALCSTNMLNSSFHKNLTAAQVPQNIPYLIDENRTDAINCDVETFKAFMSVCYEIDETTGDYNYTFEDKSEGDLTGATYQWTVYFSDGSSDTSITAANGVLTLTAAQHALTSLIALDVTVSGETKSDRTPIGDLSECC